MTLSRLSSFALTAGLLLGAALSATACHPAYAEASPGKPQPAAIAGTWRPQVGKRLVVRIEQAADVTFSGVVTAAPDDKLVGKPLLRGITYDAKADEWRGEVFAPRKRSFVPARLKMTQPTTFVLTAGSGALTKDFTWERA
jgi:hypothetical protein